MIENKSLRCHLFIVKNNLVTDFALRYNYISTKRLSVFPEIKAKRCATAKRSGSQFKYEIWRKLSL